MRRLGILRIAAGVACLLTSSAVISSSSASAAVPPGVSIAISNMAPERGTSITVNVCFVHAVPGEVLGVDHAAGTAMVFGSFARQVIRSSSGCASWSTPAGTIGVHPFRALILKSNKVLALSGVRTVRTYGPVDLCAYINSNPRGGTGDCDSGSVQVANNIFSYSALADVDAYPTFSTVINSARTTCRSVSVNFVGWSGQYDVVSDDAWIQVISTSLDPQTASTTGDAVGHLVAKLDGMPWNLSGSANGGDQVILSGSLDCASPTGF